MLFRCRWCERAFCEDCLDWERTKILGDNLKEYELLGFPAVDQAWYIKCPKCVEDHELSPGDLALCDNAAKEIDEKHRQMLEERAVTEDDFKKEITIPSRDESLTDATTINTSGITTPRLNGADVGTDSSTGRGRKGARKALANLPVKTATTPNRRRREAAPKSFSNSFEFSNLDLADSDVSTGLLSRKRKARDTLSITPRKRSNRLSG